MIPAHEVAAVRASVDLGALIGRDTPLHRESAQSLCGPCPWCAGRDRFTVRPQEGRWFCRGCSRQGDAIAYLRERDCITFQDALQALRSSATCQSFKQAPEPRREASRRLPDPAWQSAALVAVGRAEAALWGTAGERARAWLGARGLREETLRACRVGFTRGGIVDGLRLSGPAIVLPWFIEGEVWALKLRMLEVAPGAPRYLWGAWADRARAAAEPTGTAALYHTPRPTPGGRPIVLVEGEFDAILLWQEAGDLADVATLGSASKPLDTQSMRLLWPYPRVLVAYDADEAGDRGAADILERLGRARRASSPAAPPGKDLTDAHRQGVDLRAWLTASMAAAYPDEAPPGVAPPQLQAPAPLQLLRPQAATVREAPPLQANTERPGSPCGGWLRMPLPGPDEDTTEADAAARRLAYHQSEAAYWRNPDRHPRPPARRWDSSLMPGACKSCGTRPRYLQNERCKLCQEAWHKAWPAPRVAPDGV